MCAAKTKVSASLHKTQGLERLVPTQRNRTLQTPERSPQHPQLTKRLQVAIVAPSLKWVGGQSAQADLLMRHWKDDPDVEASFIAVDQEFPAFLSWAENVPYLRTVLREPLYGLRLYRKLQNVDIAHVFSASYWSFLLGPALAMLIAHMLGKKVLINYRSGEAADHLERSRLAIRLLTSADLLVVPSGYLARVFDGFGLSARAVPNVIDTSQFIYRERHPLKPKLICPRGFGPYYQVDLVVRAFRDIQEKFVDATLSLPGKGSLENNIRRLVRELKLRRVEFPGAVSRDKIGTYYDQADIFVNASYVDNMPVSILEAFAAGTPVVSTAPEGVRYIVEHERTGLLCEPGDWQALGANVIRLLRDPDFARCLAQNAHEESHRYRWEVIRAQWLEAYQSLILEK